MMLKKPLIPLSLVRDLRCRQCEKFVSCGPVYVVPDTSILCGRCRHLAKNIYRNTSYEALASIFMYPCCNWEEHCSTHLHWNESLQHEEDCNYKGFCKFLCHHPRAYCKGKREIPEGDVRLTPVPEQLLDYIKCVQCECYLTCEPVYVQTNGKNVCHRCVHANGVPPNCLRNTAYEKLSTIIIFPCIYRNRGCPTRLKFGRSLWQHEAECSYGQTFKKITNQRAGNQKVAKQANQKERGVIQTHSGHYYGTLTPNGVLFAPPTEKTEFDMNRELLKSLKKQQERRFVRADEIGTQLEKFNSEDGSINTDDSEKKNSYSKSWESERSSPRLDENDQRQKAMNHNQPLIVEPGYFSNNPKSPHINGENYYQNTFIAQVHREDYPSPRISRQNSYNKAHYANMVYANGFGDQNSGTNNPQPFSNKKPNVENNILAGHYPVIRTSSGIRDQNEGRNSPKPRNQLNSIDDNALAGHYPVFMYPSPVPNTPSQTGALPTSPFNGGLQYTPSFNGVRPHSPSYNANSHRFSFNSSEYRLARTESTNSNKELIEELKVKLMKTNSIKEAVTEDIYKECQNLDEILEAHDRIDT